MARTVALALAVVALACSEKPPDKHNEAPVGATEIAAARPAAVVAPPVAPTPPPAIDAGAAAAPPGEPESSEPIACEPAALRALRKRAQADLDAGRIDGAIARLARPSCWIDANQAEDLNREIAWVISDKAYAYLRAGQPGTCYSIAESELMPYSGNVSEVFGEDVRVIKALTHNSKICRAAIESQWGTFESAPCAIASDEYGIPAAIRPPGTTAACIVIGEGKRGGEDDLWQCGDVALAVVRGGKRVDTKLTLPENSTLADGSVCCNTTAIGFQRKGDLLRIRVASEGRDCNGGTASAGDNTLYELRDDTLVPIDGFGALYH